MKMTIRWTVAALICLTPLTAARAQDVAGVWKGPVTDPQGGTQTLIFDLKVNAQKVTGFVTTMGPAQPISNGLVVRDQLTFEILMIPPDRGRDTMRIAVSAKLSANRLEGTATMPGGPSIPFVLTRAPAGATSASSSSEAIDAGPPNPQGANPRPADAQQAILAAFASHSVVGGLGVTNKDADDFILALVRNPDFARTVNDIAIECGNSLYQPVLDRYTSGEEVPLAEVRKAWRNTTQPNCGYAPFYEQLVALVRRINVTLPPERKLRVLACDPPIDWDKVRTANDLTPFMNRDKVIAAVIEREVLAKHRKALMPFGINHVRHGLFVPATLEKSYPGAFFVVADYSGLGRSPRLASFNYLLEQRMVSWPVPSLVMMNETWLADLPAGYFDEGMEQGQSRGYPGVDALLYLGPRDLLLQEAIPARVALDSAYIAELQRRAEIRGNPDGPRKTLQREMESSVLLFDRPRARPGGQ